MLGLYLSKGPFWHITDRSLFVTELGTNDFLGGGGTRFHVNLKMGPVSEAKTERGECQICTLFVSFL